MRNDNAGIRYYRLSGIMAVHLRDADCVNRRDQ